MYFLFGRRLVLVIQFFPTGTLSYRWFIDWESSASGYVKHDQGELNLMKKLLTLLFAVALSLSMSSFAFAQDAGTSDASKTDKKEMKKEQKMAKKKAKKEKKSDMKKDEMKKDDMSKPQ